jgi:hypothetical protein
MADSSPPNPHRRPSSSDSSTDISVDLESLPPAVDVNVDADSFSEGTIEISGITVFFPFFFFFFFLIFILLLRIFFRED